MTLSEADHQEESTKKTFKNESLLFGMFSDSSDSSVYDLRDSGLAGNNEAFSSVSSRILMPDSTGLSTRNEASKNALKPTSACFHSPFSGHKVDDLFEIGNGIFAQEQCEPLPRTEVLKRRVSLKMPSRPKRRRIDTAKEASVTDVSSLISGSSFVSER